MVRQGHIHSWLDSLFSDCRFALRQLRKAPGFTVVVVLTLALGIGVNTAIFSVVNRLFLHPPGVTDPDRVVVLRVRYGKLGLKSIVVSARRGTFGAKRFVWARQLVGKSSLPARDR